MLKDMCRLSLTLPACLRCRTLIGTYLVCGFVRPDCAVLAELQYSYTEDARREHARTWYKKRPTKATKKKEKTGWHNEKEKDSPASIFFRGGAQSLFDEWDADEFGVSEFFFVRQIGLTCRSFTLFHFLFLLHFFLRWTHAAHCNNSIAGAGHCIETSDILSKYAISNFRYVKSYLTIFFLHPL